MARVPTEVELPRILRAPGGHAVYGIGQPSICPYHAYCAYTGDEPGLCAECHDLPSGRTRPCFCDYCGELFTSISAFDQHQRPYGVCRDPERRGLVQIEQNGWLLWGAPGSPPPRED
jgi:hypothetical protein